jgi:hypothetical protein
MSNVQTTPKNMVNTVWMAVSISKFKVSILGVRHNEVDAVALAEDDCLVVAGVGLQWSPADPMDDFTRFVHPVKSSEGRDEDEDDQYLVLSFDVSADNDAPTDSVWLATLVVHGEVTLVGVSTALAQAQSLSEVAHSPGWYFGVAPLQWSADSGDHLLLVAPPTDFHCDSIQSFVAGNIDQNGDSNDEYFKVSLVSIL